jgi:hypothetical protein
MMRFFCAGLFALLAALAPGVEAGPPKQLSAPAVAVLKPLMKLRNRQVSDQFTADGRWRGESRVTPEVERRIYRVLRNRTPAGDEAVAYLVTVYMGEHFGEEIDCEATNRGKRVLPLVQAFRLHKPDIGVQLSPIVRGEPYFGQDVVASIKKGERCEPDEP